MKIRIFRLVLTLVMTFALQVMGFAGSTEVIDVSATVPTSNGQMAVTIREIDAKTKAWGGSASSIDFGTLELDPANNVFRAPRYYAVDVSVNDNTGRHWQLAFGQSSLVNTSVRPGSNLAKMDFSVSARKVVKGLNGDVESSAGAMDRTSLFGGWLRLYCGLDNVPADRLAGNYSGTLTITLTP